MNENTFLARRGIHVKIEIGTVINREFRIKEPQVEIILIMMIINHDQNIDPGEGALGPEKYGYVRLDRRTPYPLPFMIS